MGDGQEIDGGVPVEVTAIEGVDTGDEGGMEVLVVVVAGVVVVPQPPDIIAKITTAIIMNPAILFSMKIHTELLDGDYLFDFGDFLFEDALNAVFEGHF